MKFKKPIEVQAGISDGDPTNPLGQAGYLLSSDGSNVNWISPGGLSAQTAEAVVQPIKANEALTKGDPLYIVGYQAGQNVNIVAKADSSDAAKMPVVGLADDDYASQNFGTMTAFGSFNGSFDTTGGTENWAIGDIIFVKAGGGLTNVKPTGTDLIQNIAIVSRVQQNTGELEVIALGRTNDVPNLPTGRLFVGTSANTSLASDVIYVDDTSNRVGIGTANPSTDLEVSSTGVNGVDISQSASNASQSGRLFFTTNTASEGFALFNSNGTFQVNSGGIPNNTSGTNIISIIGSSGNVGIGTTNTSGRLTIGNGLITDNSTMFNVNGQYNDVGFNGGASGLLTQGVWSFINSATWDQTRFYVQDQNNSNSRLTFDFKGNAGNIDILAGTSSGNVGIGTTNPPSKLSVSGGTLSVSGSGAGFGVVKLGDPTDSNPYVGIYRSAAAAIATSGNFLNLGGYDGIAFTTGAAQLSGQSERMRILSNGNVGIGETDPDSKLHIKTSTASSSDMLLLENYGWAANMTTGIAFKNGSNYTGQTAKIYTIMNGSGNQGGEIRFATLDYSATNPNPNTTLYDRMTIDDLGGVGIGTTSPDVKLEVESTTSTSGIRIKNTNSGYASLDVESNRVTGENLGGLRYRKTGQSFSQAEINYVAGTRLDFLIGNGTAALTNKLSILENGDVGINDNNPSYKLDVAGTGRFTDILRSDKFLQIQGAGTTANEGKGVGLSLTDDFPYVGNDSNTRYLNHYGMGIHKPLQASIAGGDGAYLSGYFGVDIFTSGNSRIHVNQNGNVGIGITNPSHTLEVAGTVQIKNGGSGYLYFHSTNNFIYGDQYNSLRAYAGDNFRIVTNSGERMRILNNGNVGIGTTDPTAKTHIEQTIANGTIAYPLKVDVMPPGSNASGDGTGISFGVGNNGSNRREQARITVKQNYYGVRPSMSFDTTDYNSPYTDFISRILIDPEGNVGIGTTNPAKKVTIGNIGIGNTDGLKIEDPSNTAYGAHYSYNDGSTTVEIGGVVNNALRDCISIARDATRTITIDTSERVGIGETVPSSKLYIKGTTSTTSSQLMRIKSTTSLPSSTGRMIEFIRSNDAVRGYISMNQYAVQYNTTSDYRLKENITPINDAVSRLKELKPNRFSWKEGPSAYKVDGFIAHELAEVIPEAVSGEKDAVDENNKPAYQGIDQAKIVPLLTAALQEAVLKIEQLETRIQKLENK